MKHKKLSKSDRDRLWGEDTPYSQVNLIEQTRVLGDGISRVFLVVEAEINPFTFEYALANRDVFANDLVIQQLLDHAEFRGMIEGYVVCAGEEELRDKRSFEVAFSYKELATKNVLKMHDLVIRDFGLKRGKHSRVKIDDPASLDRKYVWDQVSEKVIPVDENLLDSESIVNSPAGAKNGKIRYFVVLALASALVLKSGEVKRLATITKSVAAKSGIEIEEAEAGKGHIMLTLLIGPDKAPADFIEKCIDQLNGKSKLFYKHYFVTNVSRPTGNEMMSFVNSVRISKSD